MTLKEFIETIINDSVDNTRDSLHLTFPILINGKELDFGDVSVTHLGTIEVNTKDEMVEIE